MYQLRLSMNTKSLFSFSDLRRVEDTSEYCVFVENANSKVSRVIIDEELGPKTGRLFKESRTTILSIVNHNLTNENKRAKYILTFDLIALNCAFKSMLNNKGQILKVMQSSRGSPWVRHRVNGNETQVIKNQFTYAFDIVSGKRKSSSLLNRQIIS